jgi:hypothetical protein
MKKNPGRKELRARIKRNRTMKSDKKQAINERKMLWMKRGRLNEAKS